VLIAIESAKASHTLFYIFGGCLIAFALLTAGFGILRHETFPPSAAVGRALSLVMIVLVVGTMIAAATES
jgi:hypothetical protein